MKRYRVLNFDLDSRALLLSLEIQPTWEPHVREQHRRNQINTIVGLVNEFGGAGSEAKIQNLVDLGSAHLSVLAFHNKFLYQIRSAFIIGAYYPALTGACALGERILNHLILKLRNFFRNTPEYKKVSGKQSFDNWTLAIETLNAWEVLLPEVVVAYRQLAEIRNQKAIHFNPEAETGDRQFALEAIRTLSEIIRRQFSGFGPEPWFIPNIPGKSFIKKEAETLPFIQTVYIPNCVLVGPYHQIQVVQDQGGFRFVVEDNYAYEERDISDDEFAELCRTGSPPAEK